MLVAAKDTWLKENRLDEIHEAIQWLAAQEKKIKEIQCGIDAIHIEVEREKAVHPEYASYQELSKHLHNQQKEYDAVCRQIDVVTQTIAALPQNIQTAQDEFKKHTKYAELRAQEAQYMSPSFLRAEIAKVDAQIARLINPYK